MTDVANKMADAIEGGLARGEDIELGEKAWRFVVERLRAASEWRDISTAPRDGLPVELWHRVWCCPITVQWKIGFISDLPWIEKTKTTAWPMEAFSHWRPATAPPQRNEVKK